MSRAGATMGFQIVPGGRVPSWLKSTAIALQYVSSVSEQKILKRVSRENERSVRAGREILCILSSDPVKSCLYCNDNMHYSSLPSDFNKLISDEVDTRLLV